MMSMDTCSSFSWDSVTRSGGNIAFQSLVERHAQLMSYFQIAVESPSERAMQEFDRLSLERRSQVFADLLFTVQLLEEMRTEFDESMEGFSFDREIAFMKKAMGKRRLKFSDPNVLDLIDEGDIIEIYNHRGNQLYRSWTYYKYCAYSPVDLLVYDWSTLYARPSWVEKRLLGLAPSLFVPGARTIAYEMPEYLLFERFSAKKRGLLFLMKYASPLLDVDTGLPVAFVSTGQLTPIPNLEMGHHVEML